MEIVAHEEVAAYLVGMADPSRPVPTQTFGGSMTLDVGGERIELDAVGPYHSAEADPFITPPRAGQPGAFNTSLRAIPDW